MTQPIRRLGLWCAVGSLAVLSASPLWAQEGVTLAYKYQPGTTHRLGVNMNVDMALTMEGLQSAPGGGAGAAGLGPIPITTRARYTFIEKVAGTRDGVGTLALKADNMAFNVEAMGTKMAFKVVNGKMVGTMNGQPMSNAQAPAGAAAFQRLGRLSLTVRQDARGNRTPVEAGAPAPGAPGGGDFLGNFGPVQIILPEGPVKVGDTWETRQKVSVQTPAAMPAEGAPSVEMVYTHTLKALEAKNGKQFAIITSTGAAETPRDGAGMFQELAQDFTGTTRFDVARGKIVSGQYTVEMGMKMSMPGFPGAPPAPGAGAPGQPGGAQPAAPSVVGGIRIDGKILMNLAEAAPPPPKPARKAPPKKRGRR